VGHSLVKDKDPTPFHVASLGLKLRGVLLSFSPRASAPGEATWCEVGHSLVKDKDPTPFHVASLGLKLLVEAEVDVGRMRFRDQLAEVDVGRMRFRGQLAEVVDLVGVVHVPAWW
jgi:hypothetical protein